mmetsp:Transcript_48130/g.58050  ORF Transcript_48130/g.58050 Transcript_48130/m.58050 type:complete len:368 (+) Transcript_48130:83-1186(+)
MANDMSTSSRNGPSSLVNAKCKSLFTKPGNSNVREMLTAIYEEMRNRQLKAVLKAGCMKSDPFFSMQKAKIHDPRRCFALSSIIDQNIPHFQWSPAFTALQARLQKLPGMRFVQNSDMTDAKEISNNCIGQLHWTLMQLVGFPSYDDHFDTTNNIATNGDKACPFTSEQYLDCIQDSLMVGGMDCSISISFIGVVVVSTGLLMVGVPSLDVNAARDTVRERLHEGNLPLLEPFVNDIVHSTLFRVVENSTDEVAGNENSEAEMLHEELIQIAKDYENVHLGTVTLNSFQIGPASWRMLQSEIMETKPLRKWKLPETHSQQENAMLGHDRLCHTVSGASGVNLAKELKMRLNDARPPLGGLLLSQVLI